MLNQIREFKKNIEQVMKSKETLDLVACVDGLGKAISNANLLADELSVFYEQEKSNYFPKSISEQIEKYIIDANLQLHSLLEKNPIANGELEQNLDRLYVLCLQSGVITFGFNSKESTRIIDGARRNVQSLEGKITEIENDLKAMTSKVQSLMEAWQIQLSEYSENEKKKIDENSNTVIADIEKESQVFKALVEQDRQILAEHVISSNKLKEEVKETHKDVTDQKASISNLLEICQQTQMSIQKTQQDCTVIKASIEAEFKSAQTLTAQIQGSLNSAGQSLAEINTKKQAAADGAAQIDQRKRAIDEFYKNIEANKQEMLNLKKNADAEYSAITAKYAKAIEDFGTKTSKIIETNQNYEAQIDETLRKAVTAGLFGAFNKRQKFLSITRFIWAGLVFLSAIGLAIAVFVLAKSVGVSDGLTLDKAFIIRTGIIVPLAWLLYFAGSQYKKERHAEEEYAFKSAISYSLEPYRRLLVEMREKGNIDCDFVKGLMQDVFDNPIKRLYNFEAEEKEEKRINQAVLKLSKEMAGNPGKSN